MVPEGWQDATLGDLVRLQRGHDLPAQNRADGNIEVIGGGGPNGHHNAAKAPAPGIVIGRSGSGIGNAWWSDKPFWPLNTGMYVTDYLGNDPRFCFLWLDWIDFTSHNSGGAQPSLNRNFIYPIPIPIPPLPEQRKIADILSTWDRAIETTEALLATARTQKRALMQSLLTGKRRFPEFEGQAWKEVRLGDLGRCIRGVSYKPVQVATVETGATIRLYRSTNIQNGEIDENKIILVPREIVTKERILRRGDLAVCMSNGSKTLVGKSAPIRTDDQIHTVGAFCAIFRPHTNALQGFIRFLFQSSKFDQHITIALAGSSINNLKNGDIEGMKFSIPQSGKEITAITEVLDAADSKISQLALSIEKLRTEKKALMQQLLTGKRRVFAEVSDEI